MRRGFRQSMAWLHTWSGLVVGWVLFAVFVTGTASYYRTEISAWMRPELRRDAAFAPEAMAAAAERGVAHLRIHAGEARAWFIGLPTTERPVIELFWRTGPGRPPGHVLLDPETGAPSGVRDTRGGDFLYRFHFELNMPPLWGRWIVGICAMIMLVALVSGIVTHRRIFADFFTFRRDKSAQRGWLDAHNVTGVLALPFHLMITYTGVVTLMLMYVPWGVNTAYKGDAQRFFAESGQITAPRQPAGRPGTLTPVGPMVLRAMETVPEPLERLSIVNPKDANASVVAVFEEPHGLSHEHPQVAFDGTTGEVVEIRAGGLKPASKTFTAMVGLHEAHFAGAVMRLLFFLCGLAGCAMVATGLVLWTVARAPKAGEPPGLGLRLVRGLNVATVAGLPAAVAAYFLANRLLPVGLAERGAWEVWTFFAVWLLVGLVAPFRPQKRAWPEMLSAAAILYAAVCAADVVRIVRAGPAPVETLFLAFDACMLALSALLLVAARKAALYDGLPRRKEARAAPRPERDRFAVQEPGE
ncbi:PepSY-associated TM helix domain-containing protein [Methylobacterium durans]|uniref:PepSY-associated TM helix domain-containing protein n=1 Tax=Methylobacterium durans TaxID=2202825 RepID=UPI002B001101|nr:PepSY-associated TM helix domain-containing protein [Methylobacterium durans]MEA1831383.1 PepSY-associated TM helix domain-containing protein [Methylobacterium durans]